MDGIRAIPWLKVPFSLPAQKRECVIFGPRMAKNSIRTRGEKLASPHLVFDNFLKVWADQVFSPWDA